MLTSNGIFKVQPVGITLVLDPFEEGGVFSVGGEYFQVIVRRFVSFGLVVQL